MNTEQKTIYSLLEDEESRFIFENRLLHNESDDYLYIQRIVERYIPKTSWQKHTKMEGELIDSLKSKKNIWIWGAGVCCTKFLREIMIKYGIEGIKGIIDRNPAKKEVLGISVCTVDKVDFKNIDCLVISMMESNTAHSCMDLAIAKGIDKNNIVMYRNYVYAGRVTLAEQQYFEDFIQYEKGEVFIDAGVLDLYTSLRFVEECKKRHIEDYKIYAFEPDERSYDRCLSIKKKHPEIDITLVNKGLWSCDTTLHFQTTGGADSKIAKEGIGQIAVVSLDSFIKEKVTFIKMDIEGAELEALKGCQDTIKKYRPKLAISVYHKKEDLIEIPTYIMNLVSDYHFYLRHYSSGFVETVLYALP